MMHEVKVLAFIKSHAQACDICGATGKLTVGSTHTKSLKLSMRCMKHIHGLRQVFMLGLDVPLAGDDRISNMARAAGVPSNMGFSITNGSSEDARDDAAWFKAHPSRAHRVREAFKGEVPNVMPGEVGEVGVVLVRQVEPSKRIRRWLTADGPIPDEDDVLAVMFDMPPGMVIPVKEAMARVKLMWTIGGSA